MARAMKVEMRLCGLNNSPQESCQRKTEFYGSWRSEGFFRYDLPATPGIAAHHTIPRVPLLPAVSRGDSGHFSGAGGRGYSFSLTASNATHMPSIAATRQIREMR